MDPAKAKEKRQLIGAIITLVVAGGLLYWQFGPKPHPMSSDEEWELRQKGQGAGQAEQVTALPEGSQPAMPQSAGSGPVPPTGGPPLAGAGRTETRGSFLASRVSGDPFDLRLGRTSLPLAAFGQAFLAPTPGLFSPGTWAAAQRDGGARDWAARPGVGTQAPTEDPDLPWLVVVSDSGLPLPTTQPPTGFQPAALPPSVENIMGGTAYTPLPPPLPEIEGMRLAGMVRRGQPSAILEWRTPQGIASQVVSPNDPLNWQAGSTLKQLSNDYAVIQDAQGKLWRAPLRW